MILQEYALRYVKDGLSVVPCSPKDKTPLVLWKDYQEHPADESQVNEWWTTWPDANIALIMGKGLFAVDVDGPAGHAALKASGIEIPPTTPTCMTGRGVHYYFRGNWNDRIGLLDKVDIRGRGIMIVPPSIHPTGAQYRWLVGLEHAGGPPQALTNLLRRVSGTLTGATDAVSWLADALRGVSQGKRDATCTRLAGYFLGKGMPKEAVEETLLGWAARCIPPFPGIEVRKCVESIAEREGNHDDEIKLPETVAELIPQALQRIQSPTERPIHTSLGWLDEMLDGGIFPNDYLILGARPGIGKTALALQLARGSASQGKGTLIVSREMNQYALVRRMLCQESQIPMHILKRGQMGEGDMKNLHTASARLARLPIWTSMARTIDDLKAHVKAYSTGVLGLIIVDYLQLVRSPHHKGGESRHAVEYVSQELRELANEVAPVLCLSSLSRPPRDVKDYRPGMGDLRESGELEHDADIILLMRREAGADSCELRVAKNREGRVGTHVLTFDGPILTFSDDSMVRWQKVEDE